MLLLSYAFMAVAAKDRGSTVVVSGTPRRVDVRKKCLGEPLPAKRLPSLK